MLRDLHNLEVIRRGSRHLQANVYIEFRVHVYYTDVIVGPGFKNDSKNERRNKKQRE